LWDDVARELISGRRIVDHVFLVQQRLARVVLRQDWHRVLVRRVPIAQSRSVPSSAEIPFPAGLLKFPDRNPTRNSRRPSVETEIGLLKALKGAEEKGLVFDDRAAQAEAGSPKRATWLTLTQVVICPGIRVQQFVVAI